MAMLNNQRVNVPIAQFPGFQAPKLQMPKSVRPLEWIIPPQKKACIVAESNMKLSLK
jgi:hypothetical protein